MIASMGKKVLILYFSGSGSTKMVAEVGCDMIITNGDQPQLLYDIVEGKQVGTRFLGRRA